ncbi:Aste57867_17868 [Aphanomyces stellatus]|uniref:Aste57867_17868 protein n=1 Tax=Aphanomyces stellatus TaxID=120398 RepID=A0A485L8N8_9STRA|nr:hypothetical protein As57867_017807 [Aphanomyces stellatus]VFT94611.1 Aste57867_17868 [Aphanomyces stellatus]
MFNWISRHLEWAAPDGKPTDAPVNDDDPRPNFDWPYKDFRNDMRTGRVYLDPDVQNIPTAPRDRHLRPPKPRIPASYDMFLGLPSYRDGRRCGQTLFSAFSEATNPTRIRVAVVDQTQDGEPVCLDEYCRLANEAWPDVECKYKDQITIDARDSKLSKGPIPVRAVMQSHIKDEEFCLTTDAHMQFLANWDRELVVDWNRTENEMAVLSTYVFGYHMIGPNNTTPVEGSHLCTFKFREELVAMPCISRLHIRNSERPQLAPLWGAGLSFSKCHAEKRAPIDPHLTWIFVGEEYVRAMLLWTQGYDIYSPSRHGLVLFHNETKEHTRDNWYNNKVHFDNQKQEADLAYERIKLVLKYQVTGPVNGLELNKYYPRNVRSVDAFAKFTGLSITDPKQDRWQCEQQHWVPYEVPEIVEELLPGYYMRPMPTEDDALAKKLEAAQAELKRVEDDNHDLLQRIAGAVTTNQDGLASAKAAEAKLLREIRDALAGATALAKQDNHSDILRHVESLLVQVNASKEAQTNLQGANGHRNVLVDYKELIVLQVLFVVAIGVFCIWRGRFHHKTGIKGLDTIRTD